LLEMVSQTAGPSAIESRPRIAVLVRAHFVSEKLVDLLRILKAGVGYDLRACADETQGPLNLPGEVVLRISTEMCSDLGLLGSVPNSQLLWYFSDYAFYCAHHCIPDYDYYIMIDWDVEFVRGDAYALESLISCLNLPEGSPYDLVGTHYGPQTPDWEWWGTCEGRFKDFYGVFFPLIVLSKRALQYLYDWRKYEAANPLESGNYVFGEAFVPSALMAAGGYRCADLNSLLPGSYDFSSFRIPPPMLLGRLPPLSRGIELVHPVYSEREYLESELGDARQNNSVAEFMTRLRNPALLPVSPALRREFLSRLLEPDVSPVPQSSPGARKRRPTKAAGGTGRRPTR